jgi:hypothetical protein
MPSPSHPSSTIKAFCSALHLCRFVAAEKEAPPSTVQHHKVHLLDEVLDAAVG